MIDRILKNWKTTAIGVLILLVCFALVFLDKATLTEVSLFIGGGFFVLFSKDSLLKKKNMMCLFFLPFICAMMFTGCRTYESFTKEKETILRDTVIKTDTISVNIYLPGDTVMVDGDRIIADLPAIENFKNEKLTVLPWYASTLNAYACAGITNNIPWLRLHQLPILIDTAIYVNRIQILEQRLRAKESQIILREPFYKITWFWISVILFIISILYIRNK